MNSKESRLNLIRSLIESCKIRSQQELLDLLKEKGVEFTQASISRYLKEIKASRIPSANGEYYYSISEKVVSPSTILSNEISSAEFAGNILVIKTKPGYSNAVSAQIDSKGLPYVAGTVSGDDTILMVIRDGFDLPTVKKLIIKEFPYIEQKFI